MELTVQEKTDILGALEIAIENYQYEGETELAKRAKGLYNKVYDNAFSKSVQKRIKSQKGE
jgi:hypothetical protein